MQGEGITAHELSEGHVNGISRLISYKDWMELGRGLGVPTKYLDETQLIYKNGFNECTYRMLSRWREMFPNKTIKDLCQAMADLGLTVQVQTVQEYIGQKFLASTSDPADQGSSQSGYGQPAEPGTSDSNEVIANFNEFKWEFDNILVTNPEIVGTFPNGFHQIITNVSHMMAGAEANECRQDIWSRIGDYVNLTILAKCIDLNMQCIQEGTTIDNLKYTASTLGDLKLTSGNVAQIGLELSKLGNLVFKIIANTDCAGLDEQFDDFDHRYKLISNKIDCTGRQLNKINQEILERLNSTSGHLYNLRRQKTMRKILGAVTIGLGICAIIGGIIALASDKCANEVLGTTETIPRQVRAGVFGMGGVAVTGCGTGLIFSNSHKVEDTASEQRRNLLAWLQLYFNKTKGKIEHHKS